MKKALESLFPLFLALAWLGSVILLKLQSPWIFGLAFVCAALALVGAWEKGSGNFKKIAVLAALAIPIWKLASAASSWRTRCNRMRPRPLI